LKVIKKNFIDYRTLCPKSGRFQTLVIKYCNNFIGRLFPCGGIIGNYSLAVVKLPDHLIMKKSIYCQYFSRCSAENKIIAIKYCPLGSAKGLVVLIMQGLRVILIMTSPKGA
jgi:hypothetical protein